MAVVTNNLTVLGWPCTITHGEKVWSTANHTPSTTGTLWYRHDKVTVHLPPDYNGGQSGGDKVLSGYLQVKEARLGGRLQTITTAHYRDTGIAKGEFGIVSFVKWLLEQNGIAPKQAPKKG